MNIIKRIINQVLGNKETIAIVFAVVYGCAILGNAILNTNHTTRALIDIEEGQFIEEDLNYLNSQRFRKDLGQMFGTNILVDAVLVHQDQIQLTTQAENARQSTAIAHVSFDVFKAYKLDHAKDHQKYQIEELDQKIKLQQEELGNLKRELKTISSGHAAFEVTQDVKKELDVIVDEKYLDFEDEIEKITVHLTQIDSAKKSRPQNQASTFIQQGPYKGDAQYLELTRLLQELEVQRFLIMTKEEGQSALVDQNEAAIAKIKFQLVTLMKQHSQLNFTPEEEADLALEIKQLFLMTRRDVYERISKRLYLTADEMSYKQKKYNDINKRIDASIEALKSLRREREVKTMSQPAKSIVLNLNIEKQPDYALSDHYQGHRLDYWISSVFGLILGLAACFIRKTENEEG